MVIGIRLFDMFCCMNVVQIGTYRVTFHCDCNGVSGCDVNRN